jgi:M6 family metalloprotease-like protein
MSARERRGAWRGLVYVLLWAALAGSAEAAFLRNVPQVVSQPDGTVLHLLATGDEYYNRLHDAAGYTIVRDLLSGYLMYAVKVDGRVQPSGLVVGRDDPTAAGLAKGVMPDPRYLPSPEELYPNIRPRTRLRAQGLAAAPEFSLINNLVIFIRFSDETGTFQSLGTYDMWFNSTAANQASMQRYFLEVSYQQLTLSSTFYPPPNGTVMASFQDSHPRAYYKPYDATTNLDGYTDAQRGSREWVLLKAAVNAVASQVAPGLDLDTNHDGYVDNVIFVVSGSAVNADWANLLWPHRWTLGGAGPAAMINGKQVGDYNFQMDGNIGVGVLCHEMTHTLGAPDLYRYDSCSSDSDLDPVGKWDLMATTMNPPQHSTAYLKWRYLGFISNVPLLVPPATVTLDPLTSPTNNCYRIASPNSASEYFVVEYRKRSFPFENMVPGSGLLVYRIDTQADGAGNSCGPPDEVYVYRPGGTATSNGDPGKANFVADAVPPRTAINDSTNPSSFLSTGFPGGLSIRDVGTAGDTITFTVDAVPACNAPGPFSLISPANGASVPAGASVSLSWGDSEGADTYDVYLGTSQDPPLLLSGADVPVQIGPLPDGETVFWRVVAKNECSQTVAPASGTWAFSVGSAGGITLLSDDFEGDLSKWNLGRTSGAGPAAWGIVGCKTASGNGAAWCAGGGTAQPACTQYAANEGTFLVAGPYSLEDAADGTWDFDLWYDVDDGGTPDDPPDIVYWMWSLDGRTYYGYGTAGTSAGWEHHALKLSDLDVSSTPIVGQPKVYFAFLFMSDGATQREGAYVDNVVIKKFVGQPGAAGPRVRRHLPRR